MPNRWEAGKAEFTVSMDGVWKSTSTNAIMGLNTWYHLACVYDESNIYLYINGVLQASTPVSGTYDPANGTTLYFGDNPTWTGRLFDGTIDDVRIWNVAKTSAEILASFTTELTGSESGLLAYWPMNEGTGTSVGDITSGANNAVMLNMDANTDWVNGFVAPGSDVGVIGIVSPALIGPEFTDQEAVTVEIKNFSTETASNFDVSYQIDGGAIVTETVAATLQPFEATTYTFSSTVPLLGTSTINIKSFTGLTNDANTNNDTLITDITPVEQYMLYDGVQHNYGSAGQTQTMTAYITEQLDLYSQILLHVDLTCPAGGCDPWDQAAQIWLKKGDLRYELARYITPYGTACGGWTFDITDFKSLLSGKSEIESYIQVWGASGWDVHVQIDLVPGTPDYMYSKVDILWDENNWVYGDPGISYDLPEQSVLIDNNAEAVKLRLTNTGHGQGNTDNAAEFKNCTHQVIAGGTQTFDHHLWNSDCNANTCSPQNGTWEYSRAGWCPGQDVQPEIFDFSGYYTPGQNLTVDYELESYTNLLNTGYNSSGHTEPFFRIMGYLITYSDSPLTQSIKKGSYNRTFDIFPNPAKDFLTVTNAKDGKLEIFNLSGSLIYESNLNTNSKQINIQDITNGVYFIKVTTRNKTETSKIIIQ